jgi:hypothetical protein
MARPRVWRLLACSFFVKSWFGSSQLSHRTKTTQVANHHTERDCDIVLRIWLRYSGRNLRNNWSLPTSMPRYPLVSRLSLWHTHQACKVQSRKTRFAQNHGTTLSEAVVSLITESNDNGLINIARSRQSQRTQCTSFGDMEPHHCTGGTLSPCRVSQSQHCGLRHRHATSLYCHFSSQSSRFYQASGYALLSHLP